MTRTKLIIFLIITSVISYLIGNINFAVLISKRKTSGKDIRSFGSGNPGAMNMIRNYGAKFGLLTLVLDVIKGFVPSFIARLAFSGVFIESFAVSDLAMYVAGLSATIGHIFPVFMKFKGGKGVATTLGLFLASSPLVTLIIFFLGVLYIYLFEFGSMGSMMFLSGMAIFQGFKYNTKYVVDGVLQNGIFAPYFTLCVLIFMTCLITWLAHSENIYKLIFGIEHKTELKKILKKIDKNKEKAK